MEMNEIIWDELTKDAKCEVKEKADGSFVMDTMPFHTTFTLDNKFKYEQDGKYIELIPVGMTWNIGSPTVVKDIKKIKSPKIEKGVNNIKYKDIFDIGISINNEVSKRGWRKIIIIDSLSSLGTIPNNAQYLEFVFEVSTNFDIKKDGVLWNKDTNITFTDNLELTSLSRIRPISAWSLGVVRENEKQEDKFLKCEGSIVNQDGKKYLIKSIPVNFLINQTYPIQTDVTITFGSEYVFNTGATYYPIVAKLSESSFVIVYQDNPNSLYGTAIIGTVSGTTISFGSEYVFNSASTSYTTVTALSSTSFIVSYQDGGGSNYGKSKVGTVSGTTISFGSAYTFNSGQTFRLSSSTLSSTTFVVAYQDNSNSDYGTAVIGSVSGSVISFGSEYVFNTAWSLEISVSALSSTSFVVGYRDVGNSNYGNARIGTVSGTTISYGTEYTFNNSTSNYVSIAALSSTSFVVGYADSGTGNAMAKLCSVSGTTISAGSAYTLNTGSTSYIYLATISASKVAVSYMDGANSNYGTASICTVSGSTLSFGSEYVFNSAQTIYTAIGVLSTTSFSIAYRDDGNSSNGTAIIGTIPADGKKINGVTYVKWNGATITKWNNQ